MTRASELTRDNAIRECLAAINVTIGEDAVHAQTMKVLRAIRALKSDAPMKIAGTVDYVSMVQEQARAVWLKKYTAADFGSDLVTYGSVETPLGVLVLTTWRQAYHGANGRRVVWAGEYKLNDDHFSSPVTLKELKEMGLSPKPTTRRRRKS